MRPHTKTSAHSVSGNQTLLSLYSSRANWTPPLWGMQRQRTPGTQPPGIVTPTNVRTIPRMVSMLQPNNNVGRKVGHKSECGGYSTGKPWHSSQNQWYRQHLALGYSPQPPTMYYTAEWGNHRAAKVWTMDRTVNFCHQKLRQCAVYSCAVTTTPSLQKETKEINHRGRRINTQQHRICT
jgi:hypothetical protein